MFPFPQDPLALDGGVGEKAVRRILQQSLKVADRSLPNDAEHLRKLTSDIGSMADTLKELRQRGQGATPQAESLAQGTEGRLNELLATAVQAVGRVEKCGIQRPAPTVAGRHRAGAPLARAARCRRPRPRPPGMQFNRHFREALKPNPYRLSSFETYLKF